MIKIVRCFNGKNHILIGDRILVEVSPVDRIWETELAKDHADASNPKRWLGLNLLVFPLSADFFIISGVSFLFQCQRCYKAF